MKSMRYIAAILVVGATAVLANAPVMSAAPHMQPIAALQTEPRFRILPGGQVQALEGDAEPIPPVQPVPQSKAVAGEAAGEQKCEKNFVFSKIFKKCLPVEGTDGYTAAKGGDAPKGKLMGENWITAENIVPGMLHGQPMMHTVQPLTAQGTNQPAQQQPTQPTQPTPAHPAPAQRRPVVGQPQQLRLACPPGFTYQPNLGSCVGFRPNEALSEARGRDTDSDDDDNNDDGDDGNDDNEQARGPATSDRRSQLFGEDPQSERERRFRRFRRYRRFARNHPFMLGGMRGRFLGTYRSERPNILAPVFVFVLPPMRMNRTGEPLVHRIHPSFVGPASRPENASVTPTPKPEVVTKGPAEPVAGETKAAPATTKPAPEPAPTTPAAPSTAPAKPAAPATTPAPASAPVKPGVRSPLHKAEFISPLVTGTSDSDNIATAKGGSAEEPAKLSELPITQPLVEDAQPLRVDSGVNPSLVRRAKFISPVIAGDDNIKPTQQVTGDASA